MAQAGPQLRSQRLRLVNHQGDVLRPGGNRRAVAEELGIHPQAVRYGSSACANCSARR